MSDERIIKAVDASADAFRRSLKRIKDQKLDEEIRTTLRSLLLQETDKLPAKLKFHQLTNKKVPSVKEPSKKVTVWSLHVTANDAYKASFTFEDGTIYLRLVDEHDVIDNNP